MAPRRRLERVSERPLECLPEPGEDSAQAADVSDRPER